MGMTKLMRMAAERMRKSMPSKPMNKNDAARVESAIRNNPKMYKGLTPSQVLEMLPPKGRTGKVIGMPIKGVAEAKRNKKPTHKLVYKNDANYPTLEKIPEKDKSFIKDKGIKKLVKKYKDNKGKKVVIKKQVIGKTTKKSFGGILKAGKKVVDAVKKKINKKDSKGNTVSILGKPSGNQTKIKKAQKQQRTTRREKAKSLGKGVLGTVAAYEGVKALTGKKSQTQSDPVPKPKKKPVSKSIPMPKPKPKKKSSGVTFGFEVIPKGGKTKKFSGGGKIGMKSGPAMPNRLY